jgi:acetyl-CoA synthetase
MVIPSLYFGKPVLAYHANGPLKPRNIFRMLEKYGVTIALLHPTVLRMMMQIDEPPERYNLNDLRVILSGGEDVGENLINWVDKTFHNAILQEAYGQSEAIGVVGECSTLNVDRLGASGKALPGHNVCILDPETAEPIDDPDTVGEIAVQYEGNPICMKKYWNLPEKTSEKIQNGWMLTEDLGSIDADGYLSYHSRKDDVINSSGRRIGPGEIEDSLVGHKSVLEAGVIGVAHDQRGEVPKAFVELAEGHEPTDELKEKLQEFVQKRLARYEYPHQIEFLDSLPKTPTGKVRRVDLRKREKGA